MNNFKTILGDICYPKSQALVITGNTSGLMTSDTQKKILKTAGKKLLKEIKKIFMIKKIFIGDYVSTEPCRLKARGVKRIYFPILKRFPSDFISSHIIREAFLNVFRQIIKDQMLSISICGISSDIEGLDKKVVANIILSVCEDFNDKIDILIIDSDKEFIDEINNLYKEF